jgi:hypothetical protein
MHQVSLLGLVAVLTAVLPVHGQSCPELPETGIDFGSAVGPYPEDVPSGCSAFEILVGKTASHQFHSPFPFKPHSNIHFPARSSTWHIRTQLRTQRQIWCHRWRPCCLQCQRRPFRRPWLPSPVPGLQQRHHRRRPGPARHRQPPHPPVRSVPQSTLRARGVLAGREHHAPSRRRAPDQSLPEDPGVGDVWRSQSKVDSGRSVPGRVGGQAVRELCDEGSGGSSIFLPQFSFTELFANRPCDMKL